MQSTQTCSKCDQPAYARGMCTSHYWAWRYVTPASERTKPTELERFFSKISQRGSDECWLWTAGTNAGGYGRFGRKSGKVVASRFALTLAVGDPPEPDMIACHTCDNPPCCNPAHLYWGTQSDNSQDAMRRGRKARGELAGKAKLTGNDVLTIRKLWADGASIKSLARQYGLTWPAIADVVKERSWTHIDSAS